MADPTPINAPPAQPPRYSLVAVAVDADLPPQALLHGWTFDPELCGASRGGIVDIDCVGSTPDGMEVATNPDVVSGTTFAIFATDRCSALDINRRDWRGRAERAINAVESYWLAKQLSTGAPGTTTGMLSLNDATVDATSGAVPAAFALAALEGELAEAMRGQRGMIHVSPAVATLLMSESAMRRDGQLWVTATENIVVIDAGYNGAGPGDITPDVGSQWMYGTSPIRVDLGEAQIVPGSFEAALAKAQAHDHDVNTVTMYVAKLATWVWDECALIAAEVDTTGLTGS